MNFICNVFCLILIHTFISCTIQAHNKIDYDSIEDEKTSKDFHSPSIKYDKQSREILSLTQREIGGTNLTTGVYYCIQDNSGKFLRWDGNQGSSRFGLILDSVDNCKTNSNYKFIIEVDSNDVIRIKNKRTNTYLAFYYSSYYFLSNSSSYTNEINFVVRDNGYLNIQTIYSSSTSYYLTNTIAFVSAYGIYASTPSTTSSYYWRFIKAQNLSPIDSDLKIRVFSFNYEKPDEEKINSYLNVFDIISPTVINNTSPAKITHEISRDEVITEFLKWQFEQSLDFFNVTIIRSLPQIVRRKTELKRMGASFGLISSTNVKKDNYFVYEREYSIRKSVDIPPQTSVSIEATVNIVEEIPIKFSSKGEITADPPISGTQIASIIQEIPNTNLSIAQILDNSVIIQLNGELIATFALNNNFDVSSFDIL
jgi:hypothetical protein